MALCMVIRGQGPWLGGVAPLAPRPLMKPSLLMWKRMRILIYSNICKCKNQKMKMWWLFPQGTDPVQGPDQSTPGPITIEPSTTDPVSIAPPDTSGNHVNAGRASGLAILGLATLAMVCSYTGHCDINK